MRAIESANLDLLAAGGDLGFDLSQFTLCSGYLGT